MLFELKMAKASKQQSSEPARRKRINRGSKLVVEFDENARREFLTGFRKRKLQRRDNAKKQAELLVNEAKRQEKQEVSYLYRLFAFLTSLETGNP